MGYRSDLVLVVKTEHTSLFEKVCKQVAKSESAAFDTPFNECAETREEDDCTAYLWVSVKAYDFQEIMDKFKTELRKVIPDGDSPFRYFYSMEVGENYEDITTDGLLDGPFDVYLSRSIMFNGEFLSEVCDE